MSTAAITSENRVPRHTAEHVNAQIREGAVESVRRAAANTGDIEARLDSLDREWDVERALETGSATLSLLGLGLGYFVTPWFYLLTFAVQAFFLQHALQGWCPPLPIFRRRGFRTRDEIARERVALKALRGDFEGLAGAGPESAARAYEIADR